MTQHLVSVIVPVYNVKDLLNRCVRSILNQTYKNTELFLIDDGSTDGSGGICDFWAGKDPRISVIHQQNAGQGSARNRALDRMHGDYVYFVDSDDYIVPEAIERMVTALESNGCDLCVCGVINDHIFKKKECPKQNKTVLYDRKQLFVSYLTEPYIRGTLCNKMYTADLFKDLRFSAIRAREDAEILYKIYGRTSKTIYIPDPLYIQYIRPGSTEQREFSEEKLYTITIYEQMAAYLQENVSELSAYEDIIIALACANVLRAIASDKNRKKWMPLYDRVEERLKSELKLCKTSDASAHWLYEQLVRTASDRQEVFRAGTKACIKNEWLTFAKKMLYPVYRFRMEHSE